MPPMKLSDPFYQDLIFTVIGPAVGAFFGFIFGYALHEISEQSKRKERKRRTRERRFFYLRLAYSKLLWISESLLTIKKDLVLPLKEEVESLNKISTRPTNHAEAQKLADLLSTTKAFFSFHEELRHDTSAELIRADFVSQKDLLFSKTTYRIHIALKSFYDFTVQRNEMISKYAEVATESVSIGQLNYFIPVLAAQSLGIKTKLEDSLFFLTCMTKQLERYASAEFPEKPFKPRVFTDGATYALLPPENHIAGYTDALNITFDTPEGNANMP